ncbi:hypothetical protein VDGD_00418 [Verticillium dahliae]|nr:Protein rds1 [Verticillium dahliae VDG1]RBR01032.1 hypothetical protein VDGD_00418 [Verticillium dahliae]
MEQTFMTIHNLSPEANILFASESIFDILGYHPREVQDRSCFEYFHPEEVPFARSVHNRGVQLDKAAVLHYARILSRDGEWVSCECCFTVVHDVLVACTSVYRRGEKSERRAIEAPQIRRLFSSSPRDPRYHMLEHLSPKFRTQPTEREPRAALIVNRFTRTLTVMFATNAVSTILGVRPDQIKDKSFYECIQENCLPDAIRCLESAKANDSIAYLRFWYRDPRREEDFDEEDDDEEEDERRSINSSDSEGGGARLYTQMDIDIEPSSPKIKMEHEDSQHSMSSISSASNAVAMESGSSSGAYQTPPSAGSRTGPSRPSPESGPTPRARRRRTPVAPLELEAVVSCTSDGLVVVLRRARPPIPASHPPLVPPHSFENGLFAAPWGQQPIRPEYPSGVQYNFQPPYTSQQPPLYDDAAKAVGGPPLDQLMSSIRDVAVFAWALIGINGNLATYTRGLPRGEAQPPDGIPIWDPNASNELSYLGPENQAVQRWAEYEKGKTSTLGHGTYANNVYHRGPPENQQRQHELSMANGNMGGNYTFASQSQQRWMDHEQGAAHGSRPGHDHNGHAPPLGGQHQHSHTQVDDGQSYRQHHQAAPGFPPAFGHNQQPQQQYLQWGNGEQNPPPPSYHSNDGYGPPSTQAGPTNPPSNGQRFYWQ